MENVPGLGQTNGARTVVDGVIEPPQTITLWVLSQVFLSGLNTVVPGQVIL